jgi:hypothetical protein
MFASFGRAGPLEELTIGKDLTYEEYPVKIFDTS